MKSPRGSPKLYRCRRHGFWLDRKQKDDLREQQNRYPIHDNSAAETGHSEIIEHYKHDFEQEAVMPLIRLPARF